MAEAVLSGLATAILKSLAAEIAQPVGSSASQMIRLLYGAKDELLSLESTVQSIQALLLDAEKQQWHNNQVKLWLKRLKDVLYDVQDLLDDVANEDLRRKFTSVNKIWKEIRVFFSKSNQLAHRLKVVNKIQELRKKLDGTLALLPKYTALILSFTVSCTKVRRRIETRTSDGASNSIGSKEIVKLEAMSNDCIAHILSFNTPRDAARFSAVSRTLRSASDSDALWHKFLSPALDLIGSTSLPPLGPSLTKKKDIFLGLCKAPLQIDDGHKNFILDKWSGKICYMIRARDLRIQHDPTSYHMGSSPYASRFPEVLELFKVLRLEVHATMEMRLLLANTHYAAYLIFKFKRVNYGFENQAVEVSIYSDSRVEQRNIDLDPDGKKRQNYQSLRERYPLISHNASATTIPRVRGDGWKDVHLGEFFVDDPPAGEVQINLMEVKGGNWKSGLVIEGIELHPTQMTSRERSGQRLGRRG